MEDGKVEDIEHHATLVEQRQMQAKHKRQS
jgi:hypothetical protein